MFLNIGTGKLHVKNPSEKCGGLGGKSLWTFLCCCFYVFVESFFEFLAAFKLLINTLEKSCFEDFYIH